MQRTRLLLNVRHTAHLSSGVNHQGINLWKQRYILCRKKSLSHGVLFPIDQADLQYHSVLHLFGRCTTNILRHIAFHGPIWHNWTGCTTCEPRKNPRSIYWLVDRDPYGLLQSLNNCRVIISHIYLKQPGFFHCSSDNEVNCLSSGTGTSATKSPIALASLSKMASCCKHPTWQTNYPSWCSKDCWKGLSDHMISEKICHEKKHSVVRHVIKEGTWQVNIMQVYAYIGFLKYSVHQQGSTCL